MSFAKIADEEIRKRFHTHTLTDDQQRRAAIIRTTLLNAALTIRDLSPTSAEQTKSLGFLEEAMFHATAAIARRE